MVLGSRFTWALRGQGISYRVARPRIWAGASHLGSELWGGPRLVLGTLPPNLAWVQRAEMFGSGLPVHTEKTPGSAVLESGRAGGTNHRLLGKPCSDHTPLRSPKGSQPGFVFF
jgi:hypothetical protein